MKKSYIAFCLVAISFSTSAFADWNIASDNGDWQDCGPAKVEAVRVEHGAIFANLSNPVEHWKVWKRIALNKTDYNYMAKPIQLFSRQNVLATQTKNLRFKTNMASSQFQSLLENALLHDKKVIIRFPGTEACNTDNWASNAVMVQLNS